MAHQRLTAATPALEHQLERFQKDLLDLEVPRRRITDKRRVRSSTDVRQRVAMLQSVQGLDQVSDADTSDKQKVKSFIAESLAGRTESSRSTLDP